MTPKPKSLLASRYSWLQPADSLTLAFCQMEIKACLLKLALASAAFCLSITPGIAEEKKTDGCVTDDGSNVLTCTCNCDSLKTACENGKATYENTPSGGKCTIGSKKAILNRYRAIKKPVTAPGVKLKSPSLMIK